MASIKDRRGLPLAVGDVVAIAHRAGNSSHLGIATVEAIKFDEPLSHVFMKTAKGRKTRRYNDEVAKVA